MKKIVVFGNSVFAENIYLHLTNDAPDTVAAFTVDRAYIKEERLFGLPVVPFENVESSFPPGDHRMTVAVSFQKVNKLREEKYAQAKAKGYGLINYISPRASIFPGLTIGDNCVILDNVTIGALVEIGNDVIIADGAIIGHHVVLKDHCFIAPGAVVLGGVTVEENGLIGANATIKEAVTVARECLIGTGVSITRNTQERGIYVNSPAELLNRRSDQVRALLTWPARGRARAGISQTTEKEDPVGEQEKQAIK